MKYNVFYAGEKIDKIEAKDLLEALDEAKKKICVGKLIERT